MLHKMSLKASGNSSGYIAGIQNWKRSTLNETGKESSKNNCQSNILVSITNKR